MMSRKRLLLICMLSLLTSITAIAQKELAGREYHLDLTTKFDLQGVREKIELASLYAKIIDQKELARTEKAISGATISYMNVKFINEKKLKYEYVFRIDLDRARSIGASDLVLSSMKLPGNISRTEKAAYTLKGRTIIAQSKKMKKMGETLTFELSADGEKLTYVTKFKRTLIPRKK